MVAFFGLIFGLLAKVSFGRVLLETFPGFFSAGAVSKEGPSKEVADNTNFVSNFFKLCFFTNEKCFFLTFRIFWLDVLNSFMSVIHENSK